MSLSWAHESGAHHSHILIKISKSILFCPYLRQICTIETNMVFGVSLRCWFFAVLLLLSSVITSRGSGSLRVFLRSWVRDSLSFPAARSVVVSLASGRRSGRAWVRRGSRRVARVVGIRRLVATGWRGSFLFLSFSRVHLIIKLMFSRRKSLLQRDLPPPDLVKQYSSPQFFKSKTQRPVFKPGKVSHQKFRNLASQDNCRTRGPVHLQIEASASKIRKITARKKRARSQATGGQTRTQWTAHPLTLCLAVPHSWRHAVPRPLLGPAHSSWKRPLLW